MLSSNRKQKLPQIAPKVYKRNKSVMSPWRSSGNRRPNTWLTAFCVPAKTAAPDRAPLPKSCTDCGCKGSTACCNVSNKTAAGLARVEPSLSTFNETLCEMTTVHNYILFRLKQCVIARDDEHKYIFNACTAVI